MNLLTNPLLGLVMIVKNEAHGILKTLDSILPFVDRATILDTGSTDGTQEIVRKRLAACEREGMILHEEPFISFSATRNRALELHGESTVFTFMPDADDVLIGGERLHTFLVTQIGTNDPAYMIAIRRPGSRGDLVYKLPLILRARTAWRYQGRVHEYVSGSGSFSQQSIPGVTVEQIAPEQSYLQSRERWKRDVTWLLQDIAENPTEPRWWFYLGQTHECLDEKDKAIWAYTARIALGGMREEVYESKFRIAKLKQSLEHPWAEVQQAYLDAYTYDPRHAEPLFAIAKHYEKVDNLPLMYLFAQRAAEIPFPSDTILFSDREIYDWHAASIASIAAYYVGRSTNDPLVTSRGRAFAERAVRNNQHNGQLRYNLRTYAQPVAELFPRYEPKPLNFQAPEHFRPLNPSIIYDGTWRVLIRTANYQIQKDGTYTTPNSGPIVTKNFMAELTDNFEIERTHEMRDLVQTPRTNFPVHGFEDCRLFFLEDRLCCTATVCDFTEDGQRQIVLLSIDENYDFVSAAVLDGPWRQHAQKNWMPLVGKSVDDARFIYRIDPEPIVIPRDLARPNNYQPGHFRGGSQAVWVDDGWLCIVHDVVWHGPSRVYTHHFVHLNEDFQLDAMTPPFFFEQRGIEFCAGLARGQSPDRLVASFGVGDKAAGLGLFKLDDVRAQLQRDRRPE